MQGSPFVDTSLTPVHRPDGALTERLFEDLLIDKRGGRQGFPREVAAELMRLRSLSTKRAQPRQFELLQLTRLLEDKGAQHLQSPSDR